MLTTLENWPELTVMVLVKKDEEKRDLLFIEFIT